MFFQIIELFFVINSISPPQKHFEGHATIAERAATAVIVKFISRHQLFHKIVVPTHKTRAQITFSKNTYLFNNKN